MFYKFANKFVKMPPDKDKQMLQLQANPVEKLEISVRILNWILYLSQLTNANVPIQQRIC